MAVSLMEHFSVIKRQLREISPELEEPDLSRIAAQLASTESLTDSIHALKDNLNPLELSFMADRLDGRLRGSLEVKLTDKL